MSIVFQLILGAVLLSPSGDQVLLLSKGPVYETKEACEAASKAWEAHVKQGRILKVGYLCQEKNAV